MLEERCFATSINALCTMSRIGNNPIKLPNGVVLTVSDEGTSVCVQGPKGELVQRISPLIEVSVARGEVLLTQRSPQRAHQAFHGLYRSLLQNMVVGVSEGYKRTLELVGVGYKASVSNDVLELNLGYSHGILFVPPPEVSVSAEMIKGKNPLVHLAGIDKQLVGQVAAKIKSLRRVDPYKGKGVRFLGEQIRRKAGKSASR